MVKQSSKVATTSNKSSKKDKPQKQSKKEKLSQGSTQASSKDIKKVEKKTSQDSQDTTDLNIKAVPVRPKGVKRPFIIFYKSKFSEIYEKIKSTVDSAKEISKLWKEMTEAQKKPFFDQYNKDKERYNQELENFKKLGGELKPKSKKIKKVKDEESTARMLESLKKI